MWCQCSNSHSEKRKERKIRKVLQIKMILGWKVNRLWNPPGETLFATPKTNVTFSFIYLDGTFHLRQKWLQFSNETQSPFHFFNVLWRSASMMTLTNFNYELSNDIAINYFSLLLWQNWIMNTNWQQHLHFAFFPSYVDSALFVYAFAYKCISGRVLALIY